MTVEAKSAKRAPRVSDSKARNYRKVACAMCGSSTARLRFRDEPFAVLDCLRCGLTYVSPRQDTANLVKNVYGPDYWRSPRPREQGYVDYRRDRALYTKTFARRWAALRHHFPEPGNALDVGCAAGFFLEVLLAEGWDAVGIEPSRAIADTARKHLGAERVLQVAFQDADLEDQSFDLVTLWDVLEHLPDPLAALRTVRRLLRQGGKLVLETQNIRSPFARILGRRWHHFKHHEHLVHFHKGTLKYALEEAGLRLLEIHSRDAGKYVRGDFIVERSARMHRVLPGLLQPILGGNWSAYVNLGDELIAVAEVAS